MVGVMGEDVEDRGKWRRIHWGDGGGCGNQAVYLG